MKKVYSARDEVDAHLVQGLLEQQGIESTVQSEGLTGIIGTVQASDESLPSLWVRDEDEARANEALAAIKQGAKPSPDAPQAAPWKCPKCGEEIEAQFTECWNCGTSRPGAAT